MTAWVTHLVHVDMALPLQATGAPRQRTPKQLQSERRHNQPEGLTEQRADEDKRDAYTDNTDGKGGRHGDVDEDRQQRGDREHAAQGTATLPVVPSHPRLHVSPLRRLK